MNACNRSANAALSAKSAIRRRLRCRMLNHCSTWFIHEQCTGGWWKTKRGCSASHACTCLPLCIRRLSSTTWTVLTFAGTSRSSCSRNAMNSACRFREAVIPYTRPVRVSKAANRFNAPQRPYSCSTRVGWSRLVARVSDFRGRGCKLVISSTHRTASSGRNGRVYRSQIAWTCSANAASRGTLADSHIFCRHGLSRWCNRIWRTVSAEIDSTTPARASWRAISVQSHCDNDRPASSGRSQTIFTACIATSGGKDRLAAAAGSVVQAVETVLQEPLDPLADVPLGQAGQPGDLDQREPVGDTQDRPASPGQAQGGSRAAETLFQSAPLFGVQDDAQRCFAASHRCHLDGATRCKRGPYHDRKLSLGEFPPLFAV